MNPHAEPLAHALARLLQAEPELIGEVEIDGLVVSGVLGHEHPMAWRSLAEGGAVEALTLVSPSRAELDALPDWRDPGWCVDTDDLLTLWWHADTRQAMLASQIAPDELRRDSVVGTLRRHLEGLHLCRRRQRDALALRGAAPAEPGGAASGALLLHWA